MITDKINKNELQAAKRLLDKAQSVAIVTHMSPDGDAMGSSLAFMHYLRALGKDPVAVIAPNRFPEFLAWMPGAEEVLIYDEKPQECTTIIATADLVMCLDFNELKRIGKLADTLADSPAKKSRWRTPSPGVAANVNVAALPPARSVVPSPGSWKKRVIFSMAV